MNNASAAMLYGKGVFTTIAIDSGHPILWEKHWRRLTTNADALHIDRSQLCEDDLRQRLTVELARDPRIVRARISLFDPSPGSLWTSDACGDTVPSVVTSIERRSAADNFRLGITSRNINSTSPLAGIKSCNYLDNILSLNEARADGCGEAVRLNEHGLVTSACMANVFWLTDGRLFTPNLSTGCLPGTTREYVLENVKCLEVEVKVEALEEAEAIFLTSAGIGIVQAAEFNGRKLQQKRHEILDLWPPRI